MNNSVPSKEYLSQKNFKKTSRKYPQNFSTTSTDFLSEMKGGAGCNCAKIFSAFDNNLDLALYIINSSDNCLECRDENGNTLLHMLIKHEFHSKECTDAIDKILSGDVENYINVQNNNGETAMLLAVLEGNTDTANKLEKLGADKTIQDNNGNYIETDADGNDDGDDDGNDDGNNDGNDDGNDDDIDDNILDVKKPTEGTCIKNIINLFNINVRENELSSLNLDTNNSFNLDTSDNLVNDIKNKIQSITHQQSNNDVDNSTSINTDKFIELLGKNMKETAPSKNMYNDDNTENTDELIEMLNTKYNKYAPSEEQARLINESTSEDNVPMRHNSDLTSSMSTEQLLSQLNNKHKINNSDSVDTDALMEAIENIKIKQQGGARKSKSEKVIGYRNLKLNSEVKNKKYKLQINYDDYYNSESEHGKRMTNELSRLIQNRKEELHNEVLNMILELLNKGLLVKKSKPVEANERNAKLIKAYIYRQISEKNPQLNGMDKILMIKKMNDDEIIAMVKSMPDLDELEKTIQKHLENKYANKKNNSESESQSESNKSKSKSDSESESESESPKKKVKKVTKVAKKSTSKAKGKSKK